MFKAFLPVIGLMVLLAAAAIYYQGDAKSYILEQKYDSDPSSIDVYNDIPYDICGESAPKIIQAFLNKEQCERACMRSTFKLIDHFSTNCPDSTDAFRNQRFEALMRIYKEVEEEQLRQDIINLLYRKDAQNFFQCYKYTKRNKLPFYGGTSYEKSPYPVLLSSNEEAYRALWCEQVGVDILEMRADLLAQKDLEGYQRSSVLDKLQEMYEMGHCAGQDKWALRKVEIQEWMQELSAEEKGGAKAVFRPFFLEKILEVDEKEGPRVLFDWVLAQEISSSTYAKELFDYLAKSVARGTVNVQAVQPWLVKADGLYPDQQFATSWERKLSYEKLLNR